MIGIIQYQGIVKLRIRKSSDVRNTKFFTDTNLSHLTKISVQSQTGKFFAMEFEVISFSPGVEVKVKHCFALRWVLE